MRQAMNVARLAVRRYSSQAPNWTTRTESGTILGFIPNSQRYQKLQQLQRHMTAEDGHLVWQKRGARDMVPYYITVFICVGALIGAFSTLTSMSFPEKKD